MARPDIEVLVGVLGGGSISGESGKKIHNQLKSIMGHVNKNGVPMMRVAVDQKYIRSQIENAVKNMPQQAVKVRIDTSNGSGSGGGTKRTVNELAQIERLMASIHRKEVKLLDVSATSKEAAEIKKQIWDIRTQIGNLVRDYVIAQRAAGNNIIEKTVRDQASASAIVVRAEENRKIKVAELNDEYDKQIEKLKEIDEKAKNLRTTLGNMSASAKGTQEFFNFETMLNEYISKVVNLLGGKFAGSGDGYDQIQLLKEIVEQYHEITNAANKLSSTDKKIVGAEAKEDKKELEDIVDLYVKINDKKRELQKAGLSFGEWSLLSDENDVLEADASAKLSAYAKKHGISEADVKAAVDATDEMVDSEHKLTMATEAANAEYESRRKTLAEQLQLAKQMQSMLAKKDPSIVNGAEGAVFATHLQSFIDAADNELQNNSFVGGASIDAVKKIEDAFKPLTKELKAVEDAEARAATESKRSNAQRIKDLREICSLEAEIIRLKQQQRTTDHGSRDDADLDARIAIEQAKAKKSKDAYTQAYRVDVDDLDAEIQASSVVVDATMDQQLALSKLNDEYDEHKIKLKERIRAAQSLRDTLIELREISDNDGRATLMARISNLSGESNKYPGSAFDQWHPDEQVADMKLLDALWDELIADIAAFEKRTNSSRMSMKKYAGVIGEFRDKIKATAPKEFTKQLDDLFDKAKKGTYEGGMPALVEAFSDLKNKAIESGYVVETLGQKIARVFKEKFGYAVMGVAADQLRRALYLIYQNVVSIDTAMTELKKVTNETSATYNKFLDEAAVRAEKLGAALTDTIDATASFARLGYDLSEASALADASLVYKNVGDGIADINEASESLISTMQAFGVQAEDSMTVVDRFNLTGNRFAISSGGVGDALMNSASALASANNTLDESIALITAANTTAQDPLKVGTTLKTISMYLRAAKTEAEEAGESTEGMAESTSKLRKEILSLTGGVVDIMSNDNTFKSTYEIVRELSEVWDSLSDVSQANILERIGGKRNSNIASALIKNFSIAEDVMDSMKESAGSALEENEKYLESIAGKISQLTSAYQSFSNKILDGGIVKGIISLATQVVKFLNLIDDVTGGATSAILTIIGMLGSVVAAIIGVRSVVKTKAFVEGIADIQEAVVKVKESVQNAIPLLQKMSTIKMISVVAGIVAVGAAIGFAIKKYKELHPTVEELRARYDEATKNLEEYNDELDKNSERIRELQVLTTNGTITFTEEAELKRLKEQNSLLEKQIKLEEERQRLAKQALIDGSLDSMYGNSVVRFDGEQFGVMSELDAFNRDLIKYKEAQEAYNAALTANTDDDSSNDVTEEVLNNRKKAVDDLYASLNTQAQGLLEHVAVMDPDGTEEEARAIEDVANAVNRLKLASGGSTAAKEVFTDLLADPKYEKGVSALRQMASEGEVSVAQIIELAQNNSAVQALLNELTSLGLIEPGNMGSFANAINDLAAEAGDAFGDVESLKESLDGLASKKELLSDLKTEVINGEVSNKTLDSLVEQQSEMEEVTVLYRLGLKTAQDVYDEYARLYEKDEDNFIDANWDKIAFNKEFFQKNIDGNEEWQKILGEYYSADLSNYGELAQKKLDIDMQLMTKLGTAWSKYYSSYANAIRDAYVPLDTKSEFERSHAAAIAAGEITYEDYIKSTAGNDAYLKTVLGEEYQTYKEMLKQAEMFDAIAEAVKGIDLTIPRNDGSSSSSTDKYKQDIEKRIKILQHQREMDEITDREYYDALRVLMKKYYVDEKKYEEEIWDLKQEILNGERDLHRDLVADKQAIADRQALAGNVSGVRETYQFILDETKKMIDSAIKYGLDENSDYVQELRQQAYDAGKAILDSIKRSYDDFASYADDFNMWDKMDISKLDYLEQQLKDIDKCYKDGLITFKDYIEAHNDVAKRLYDTQKESIETIIDMTMEMIEQETDDHVEALEKEKDAYADIIEMKKRILEDTKDEADHQEEVAEAVKEIAKLQSKIAQLSLDNSREAAAKRAELEEQLAEKQKELTDLQNDYAHDKTVDMLDESQEAFEKEKDAEIKLAEDAVDTWVERYKIAIDRIDNDWENLYEDLEDWMAIHRDSIDGPDSLKTSWENVIALKERYANMDIENIYDSLGDVAINPNASQDPKARAILQQMIDNSIEAKQAGTSDKYGIKGYLHQANIGLAADYEDLTGQKLVYNGGWRFDNKNGEFIYDMSQISEPNVGDSNSRDEENHGKAYDATVAKFGVDAPTGTLGVGRNNDKNAVKWLQYYLSQLNLFPYDIDGTFYTRTESALKAFQVKAGFTGKDVDGVYGSKTRDALPKFHTGGIIGRQGAINSEEVLAIMKTGEWALDDGRQMHTKEIFDRIKETISLSAAVNSMNKIRNSVGAQHTQTFAPHIEVNIQHNGQMSDADAKRYGERIADETLERLRTAFNKRGL